MTVRRLSLSAFFSVLLTVALIGALVAPAPTQALSSKTYSFTPTHAKNYVTTGNVDFAGTSAASTWYSPDWQYRQKITIDKDVLVGELTDFPILIHLADANTDTLRDDLYDLLFTASDGVTKLAYEREDENSVWVRVPQLSSSSDTNLYMYSGNATIGEDQQDPAEVWSNGYEGVWHMSDDPAGTIYDSTKNNNDGANSSTPMNRENNSQDGQIVNGLYFSGGHRITVPEKDETLSFTDSLSLSAWIKPQAEGVYSRIVIKGEFNANQSEYILWINPTATEGSFFTDTLQGWSNCWTSLPAAPGQWQHLSGTYDGFKSTTYTNGSFGCAPTPSATKSSIKNQSNTSVQFGTSPVTGFDQYKGVMDEIRIASVVRTPAWVRAEYVSQCDCEDFLDFSSVVESISPTTVASGMNTVTLKADRPLSFATLHSFVANAGGETPTFQLSNDAGKSWLFYTKAGWKGANPANPLHRSSAADINGHLNTFPTGDGKLLWKAYLPSGTTLDQIQIGYTPQSPAAGGTAGQASGSVFPLTVQALNTLFAQAFDREPTFQDWTYWATRMMAESKPLDAWLGAMQWAALND